MAHLEREDPWWVIRVDGIGATQSRTLATAAEWAADMVGLMTETDVSADQIEITVDLGPGLEDRVSAARLALETAGRAQADADAAEREAVRALTEAVLRTGDIATLTGMASRRITRLASA